MIGPITNRRLEDNPLVVAFTLALGFDAIGTGWALLTALDATFATCQAASLRPFAHFGSTCRACAVARW